MLGLFILIRLMGVIFFFNIPGSLFYNICRMPSSLEAVIISALDGYYLYVLPISISFIFYLIYVVVVLVWWAVPEFLQRKAAGRVVSIGRRIAGAVLFMLAYNIFPYSRRWHLPDLSDRSLRFGIGNCFAVSCFTGKDLGVIWYSW